MIKLNQELLPGCYLHRTAVNDVARVEGRTFICTSKKEDAGNINNWMDPKECYEKLGKLFIAFLGVHPVVDVTCILFLGGADEGSVLNTSNVINGGAVQIAVGINLLVQGFEFTGSASFCTQSLGLLFATVDPNDFLGANHFGHGIDPIKNILVVGHSFAPFFMYKFN